MSDNSLKSNYRSGPAWKAPKLAATDGRAARNAFSKFDYDVVHVHEEAWRRAVHNWYEFARARSGLEKWSAEIQMPPLSWSCFYRGGTISFSNEFLFFHRRNFQWYRDRVVIMMWHDMIAGKKTNLFKIINNSSVTRKERRFQGVTHFFLLLLLLKTMYFKSFEHESRFPLIDSIVRNCVSQNLETRHPSPSLPPRALSNKRVEDARSTSYRANSHKTREEERKSAGMFSSGANDRRGNELPDVLKLSSIPYGVPRLRANSNSAKYSLCKIDHSYKPSIKRVCSGCTRGCTPLRVHAPSSSGTEGRGEGMQTLKNGSVYPHSDRIRLGILENLYRFMPTISGRGRGRRAKGLGLRDVSLIHPNCVPKLDLLQRPICSQRRIIDKARGRLRRLENDPLI